MEVGREVVRAVRAAAREGGCEGREGHCFCCLGRTDSEDSAGNGVANEVVGANIGCN
jgi:hypothetical protein